MDRTSSGESNLATFTCSRLKGGYLHYDMAQLDEAIAELERLQAQLTDKVDVLAIHMDELYSFRIRIDYALN